MENKNKTNQEKKKKTAGRQNWDLPPDRHMQIPRTHSSCCSRVSQRVSLATQVSTFTWPTFTFTSFVLERNIRNKIHFDAQLP